MAQKGRLRQEMKARRASFTEAQRLNAAQNVAQKLSLWLEARPEQVIGVYLSLPVELSLDVLIPKLWQQGRILVAPRVEVEAERMRFWRLNSFKEIENGPWNVREPRADEEWRPELVLAPGLAFDLGGGRLGTGGGWYDRALGSIPVKVGVCFDSLIVPHLPCEPHDIRMDWLVSERRFARVEYQHS